jgi:transposase InsO family protein
VDLRYEFIRAWQIEGDVAGLCRRFGISRKTGYKWIDRFQEAGRLGLQDRPRRPRTSPQATDADVVAAVVEMRGRHPTWGAKKLLAKLAECAPELDLPAVSTASDIITRAGLVEPRRRRQSVPHVGKPWPRGERPNAIWCVDYKGQFKLGNGQWCYPLTISDEYSRYLLACRAYDGIDGDQAKACFVRLFECHGLPEAIRSDNGSPFANIGLCRLSRLSVWWMRLGIALKRNVPGHPEHNGRHERIHRDLKAETTRPPQNDLARQQRRFDAFVRERNHDRPHEALGQQPPARFYVPSPRPYPSRLPEAEYPAHYEVRRVAPNGSVSLWGKYVFLSHALCGELIGLIEEADGLWTAYFGNLRLGIIDRRNRRLADSPDAQDSHEA